MNSLELLFWAFCAVGFLSGTLLIAAVVHARWSDRQHFHGGHQAEDWPATSEERQCQQLARTRFVAECHRRRGRRVLGERLALNGRLRRL